jgi:hypothetical protein
MKVELEKLREFLYGAYLATNDDNIKDVLDLACLKIDEILKISTEDKDGHVDLMYVGPVKK